MRKHTKTHPYWLHFGAGNLFKQVHAPIAQNLLNQHEVDSGIIVAETFDPDIITQGYEPYDNCSLSVILKADGSLTTELIASVSQAYAVRGHDQTYNALKATFTNPELQMVTVSITEKGYAVRDAQGKPLSWMVQDFTQGPEHAVSTMAILAALLYARYKTSAAPLAMISTDNFSQNRDCFRASIIDIAKTWQHNALVEPGFVDYVCDQSRIAFPLSMIDRITPNPAPSVARQLENLGFQDTQNRSY